MKPRDILNAAGLPACQSHFDRPAARLMRAVQARGQRRGIVGDHQIARVQQIDKAARAERGGYAPSASMASSFAVGGR